MNGFRWVAILPFMVHTFSIGFHEVDLIKNPPTAPSQVLPRLKHQEYESLISLQNRNLLSKNLFVNFWRYNALFWGFWLDILCLDPRHAGFCLATFNIDRDRFWRIYQKVVVAIVVVVVVVVVMLLLLLYPICFFWISFVFTHGQDNREILTS